MNVSGIKKPLRVATARYRERVVGMMGSMFSQMTKKICMVVEEKQGYRIAMSHAGIAGGNRSFALLSALWWRIRIFF